MSAVFVEVKYADHVVRDVRPLDIAPALFQIFVFGVADESRLIA
jgi:hypothetical protein